MMKSNSLPILEFVTLLVVVVGCFIALVPESDQIVLGFWKTDSKSKISSTVQLTDGTELNPDVYVQTEIAVPKSIDSKVSRPPQRLASRDFKSIDQTDDSDFLELQGGKADPQIELNDVVNDEWGELGFQLTADNHNKMDSDSINTEFESNEPLLLPETIEPDPKELNVPQTDFETNRNEDVNGEQAGEFSKDVDSVELPNQFAADSRLPNRNDTSTSETMTNESRKKETEIALDSRKHWTKNQHFVVEAEVENRKLVTRSRIVKNQFFSEVRIEQPKAAVGNSETDAWELRELPAFRNRPRIPMAAESMLKDNGFQSNPRR